MMTGTTGSRARLDLSGPWQLAFDPGGEGIRGGWTRENWPEARSVWVEVPALWNVSHPDAEGVGFYRRSFSVPAEWRGRGIRLHFGGACYRAEAWLNGAYVGSHEGAYTPFWFDVTPLVRIGAENLLVVRVAALSKTRDVDGMVLLESPASKQSWYYTHGGLWGEVFLESVPPLFCQSVTVEPDPHQEMVLVEVTASNRHAESQRVAVHLQVAGPDGSLLWRVRVLGGMIGSLFIRSYERSERIYAAMLSRGFAGEIRSLTHLAWKARDSWAGVGWGVALVTVTILGQMLPWHLLENMC